MPVIVFFNKSSSRKNSTASFKFRTVLLLLLVKLKKCLFLKPVDPYWNHHHKNRLSCLNRRYSQWQKFPRIWKIVTNRFQICFSMTLDLIKDLKVNLPVHTIFWWLKNMIFAKFIVGFYLFEKTLFTQNRLRLIPTILLVMFSIINAIKQHVQIRRGWSRLSKNLLKTNSKYWSKIELKSTRTIGNEPISTQNHLSLIATTSPVMVFYWYKLIRIEEK